MKIAIIDDGVNVGAMKIPVQTWLVQDDKVVQDNADNKIPTDSHGTVCAKIIEKYCGSAVEMISIRVLGQKGTGDLYDLITALRWCLDKQIAFINLSNGVSAFADLAPLYEVCYSLHESGSKIVAAQNNLRFCTYPADFPFVISVEDNKPLYPYSLMQSDIYTRSEHTIFFDGYKQRTERCNSYACAYATAQLAGIALGKRKRLSAGTKTSFRLSDNTVQWLEHPILLDDFLLLSADSASDRKNGRFDLIVAADFDFTGLTEKLHTVRSVVCYRSLPKKTIRLFERNSIFYWDPAFCDFFETFLFSDRPVILFLCTEETDLTLFRELIERFRSIQYKVAAVADSPRSCQFGLFYAEPHRIKEKKNAVSFYLNPELYFVVTTGKSDVFDCDMRIEIKPDRYILECETETVCATDIDALFSEMVRLLTE